MATRAASEYAAAIDALKAAELEELAAWGEWKIAGEGWREPPDEGKALRRWKAAIQAEKEARERARLAFTAYNAEG